MNYKDIKIEAKNNQLLISVNIVDLRESLRAGVEFYGNKLYSIEKFTEKLILELQIKQDKTTPLFEVIYEASRNFS